MSAKVETKTPSSVKTVGSSAKAGSNTTMYIIFGVIAIAFIALILFTSGGEKKTAKSQDVVKNDATSAESAVGTSSAKVYEKNNRQFTVEANQGNVGPTMDANSKLDIYVDPTTNQEYVVTPTGPILTSSIEGRKFIEDFNNLQAQASQSGAANQQQAKQIAQAEIDALATTFNGQVQALDEKLNEAYANTENLKALVKKQNDTITAMAMQIQTIQPIVKTPEELAKDLFGKEGKKVLTSRNNSIAVDSIVGNKAWFTDANGNQVLLAVGDIVPNTSLKVAAIDASTNSVIVNK